MGCRLGLALLVSFVLSGCVGEAKDDDSLNRVRQAGYIRIATDPGYPPFSYLNDEGELAGYDVELGRELGNRLGVKATFVGIEVTSVFDALIARKADVAISAVSPAAEYGREIGFSRGYFNAGQVFITRSGSKQIGEPKELENAVLGIEIGSTGELEARKMAKFGPGLSLLPFESVEAEAQALSAGRCDAIIADRVTAIALVQTMKELKINGEPFTYEPYVVAVRRSGSALLREINAILGAMAEDGFLKSLERRFLLP
ncbi:MAG: ABC transporter substrate-binding protein [Dehalococcoidia bacterium]|nr:ABC transporter substrate-binding protein [Dehalococcoidia bacterium]